MAKRILAIVLALALSLSLLSVEMFAASLNPTIQKSGSDSTAVTVKWSPVNDASYYTVQLRKDGSAYGTAARVTPNADNSNLYYDRKDLPGGTYTATVSAYDKTNTLIGAEPTSGNVDIPLSGGSSSSYKVTVSGTTGNVTVSWNAYQLASGESGKVTYEVEYASKNASGVAQPTQSAVPQDGTATTVVLPLGNNTLTTVTVYYKVGTSARKQLTSYNVGSSSAPNVNGLYIDYTNYTLRWDNVGNYNNYTISYVVNFGQYSGYTSVNTNNFYFGDILRNFNNPTITFTVKAYSGVDVGTVTYSPYGGSMGYPGYPNYYPNYNNGIVVNLNAGYATVSWSPVSGVSLYTVTYIVGGQTYTKQVQGTSINLDYSRGLTVTVQYSYNNSYYGGYLTTLGTATVTPNGLITYGGSSVNSGNNSNYVTGSNCQLNVGVTTSTVTWGAFSGATYYEVIYTDNATGRSQSKGFVYGTTTDIPLGYSNSSGFAVTIIYYMPNGQRNICASANYSGNISNSNSNYTESYTRNLTLTQLSGSQTRVSWNAVTGVSYYLIVYSRIGDSAAMEQPLGVSATSFDLPFSKNNGFTVEVYAWLTSGRSSLVGEAVHIAGDSFDNKPQSSTTTTPAYVTNFKGTSGNTKISLSWNAASGNPTYTVYWKRTSDSSWKKLGTTSKKAVTVTGLVNGRSYDFKITANGKDSGILTLAPQASGSKVATATDPDGNNTSSKVPVITSATGGSGSITVNWNGVTGAKSYQVWVAVNGSNTYNHKATVSGTSATIKGLAAGTYKVRVKASTDGKTWPTLAEASSDYVTVTVK